MKKVINLLGILLLVTILFSCGKNTKSNSESENNNSDTSVVMLVEEEDNKATKLKDEVVFSKFEQYWTILTKKDLIAQFGKANLKDQKVTYAEGTVEKEATILTNPQNGQVITYVWKDDHSTTSCIEAHYNIYNKDYELLGTQKIETENGLSLGMSLLELKDWNGDDFKFSGFGWDYSGSVFPEKNSKISNSAIVISLDLLEYEGADFAIGDVQLSTDDSRLDKLNIIVSELIMYIE